MKNKLTSEELTARIQKVYETRYPFHQTTILESAKKDKNGNYPETDISRTPVDMVELTENILIVIDQPKNWKDYFARFGGGMFGVRGAGTATVFRKWFYCRLLYLDTMTIETSTWHGGTLPKDMKKAEKKLEKFKKCLLKTLEKKDLPRLQSVEV